MPDVRPCFMPVIDCLILSKSVLRLLKNPLKIGQIFVNYYWRLSVIVDSCWERPARLSRADSNTYLNIEIILIRIEKLCWFCETFWIEKRNIHPGCMSLQHNHKCNNLNILQSLFSNYYFWHDVWVNNLQKNYIFLCKLFKFWRVNNLVIRIIRKLYRRSKPLLDYFNAIIILLITSPVLLLIGLTVKLTSPGPVFYTQERVGKDGCLFRIVKFRTMCVDA